MQHGAGVDAGQFYSERNHFLTIEELHFRDPKENQRNVRDEREPKDV